MNPTVHVRLRELWEKVMETDSASETWQIILDQDSLRELYSDGTAREFGGDGSITSAPSGLKWRGIPIKTVFHLGSPSVSKEVEEVSETGKYRQITIEYKNRAGRSFYLDDPITSEVFTKP